MACRLSPTLGDRARPVADVLRSPPRRTGPASSTSAADIGCPTPSTHFGSRTALVCCATTRSPGTKATTSPDVTTNAHSSPTAQISGSRVHGCTDRPDCRCRTQPSTRPYRPPMRERARCGSRSMRSEAPARRHEQVAAPMQAQPSRCLGGNGAMSSWRSPTLAIALREARSSGPRCPLRSLSSSGPSSAARLHWRRCHRRPKGRLSQAMAASAGWPIRLAGTNPIRLSRKPGNRSTGLVDRRGCRSRQARRR